ncbi:MAG: hypothetical protein ABIQ01_05760 [Pseudolysinimonas sp.]
MTRKDAKAAQRVNNKTRKSHHARLSAYRCELCEGYHLGRLPKPVIRGEQTRDQIFTPRTKEDTEMSTTSPEEGTPPDGGWHRGDWMQTFTGRKFFPLDPRPEDVDPVDIAHALSNLCRYAGHVDRFYSVAEHCVLMSLWLRDEGKSAALQLEALLHDATEAYVVDMPRPLKINLPDYQAVEAGVQRAVWQRFGLPVQRFVDRASVPIESPLVKEADTRILLDERAALMSRTHHPWGIDSLEPLGVNVIGMGPQTAEINYLARLQQLGVDVEAAA